MSAEYEYVQQLYSTDDCGCGKSIDWNSFALGALAGIIGTAAVVGIITMLRK